MSTLLAALSWRFIEQPVLARPLNRGLVTQAIAASLVAVVAGTAFIITNGFPRRFPPQALQLFAQRNDSNPMRERCHDKPHSPVTYSASCRFGTPGRDNAIAVWGDSFGAELAPALGKLLPKRTIMELTSSGCPPAPGYAPTDRPQCASHNQEILSDLVRDRHVRTVILVARYFGYEGDDWSAFQSGFTRAITTLKAAGKHVVLVYPIPEFFYSVPDATGLLAARGISPQTYHVSLKQFRSENALAIAELDRLSARYNLPRVFPDRIFCSGDVCPAYDGRHVLYFDSTHVSTHGARKLAAALMKVL